jgi:hypothetical protein
MANLFQDNSYNILGLDTSASQKEINKRAKEIINLLRIEEEPNYETDIKLSHVKRTENNVKDALQKLTSPTKRVREYFFWFDVESDKDEKAMSLLKTESYVDAIAIWEEQGSKETANGFVAKKNLAVLTSLLLLTTGQKKYLTQSIGAWKDILQSEKFLPHFEKIYALNDEVGTSKATIHEFVNGAKDELSDLYADVSEKHNDRSYYSLFTQVFAVKGQKIQRDVLSPIYEAIHDVSEKLSGLNISEDNIISDDEIRELKRLTKSLQDNFDKLKELGLYEDSQSKTMRDKAAEALRTVGLDLYNNLNESAKPAALFNIAYKIAGTVGLQNKLKKDIEQLRKNVSNEKFIKPINDLLSDEKYSEALTLIESQKDKYKNDDDLTTYFNTRIQWCVTGIATKDFKECMEQFNNKHFGDAERNMLGLKEFIFSYIGYFDINRSSIDGVLKRIDELTSNPGLINIDNIQAYRNKIIEEAPDSFKEQYEEMILIILVDCSIYANLAVHRKTMKITPPMYTLNGVGTKIYGDTLYLVLLFFPIIPLASYSLKALPNGSIQFYAKKSLSTGKKLWLAAVALIILIIIISAMSGSDSSPSSITGSSSNPASSTSTYGGYNSSQAAYNTCKSEYDSLKSDLDSVEAQMKQYEAYDNTSSYNALVPRQNSLVQQLNTKATECNGLR